LRVRGAS